MKFIYAIAVLFVLSSCLKTRRDAGEIETPQVFQRQNQPANQKSLPPDPPEAERAPEVNEELRALHGRIEVLENALKQSQEQNKNTVSDQKYAELEKKLALYQEELVKMEAQVAALQTIKSEAPAKNDKKPETKGKNTFDQGEELFKQKDWKNAILTYQKYRDANPKGAKFAEATYKIGVSFQELGLKDEAKTFFDEVVTRFPQAEVAKKAKYRLSQMKK